MKIKIIDGQLTGVYSESVVRALMTAGLELGFDRLSVIEPVENGVGFQIVWRNQRIIASLKEPITLNDGKPFATYESAVRKELDIVNSVLMG